MNSANDFILICKEDTSYNNAAYLDFLHSLESTLKSKYQEYFMTYANYQIFKLCRDLLSRYSSHLFEADSQNTSKASAIPCPPPIHSVTIPR